MSDDSLTFEVKGLDSVVKALKNVPSLRVGILGDSARTGDHEQGLTNAQVGAAHEFGTSRLPVRSFLRMPITMLLESRMEQSGAFDKDALAKVVETKSALPWIKKIGVLAEGLVLESFDTGGFGTWIPSNMRFKKVHQTLVESGQLRNSVSHEVAED